MRKNLVFIALLFSAGLLAGCATPTTLVLKDGSEILTKDAPKYDKKTGFYEFERFDGKVMRVNRDEVVTIQDTK